MIYERSAVRDLAGAGPGRFRDAIRGLALDGDETLWVVGDTAVAAYSRDGSYRVGWPTAAPPWSVAVDGERVWVGEVGQVEVFEPDGTRVDVLDDEPRLGLVTAIAPVGDGLLAADARHRLIRHYDSGGGFLNDLGAQHRKGGFHIPNGIVDFAVGPAEVIHATNPGMHRVERYRVSGEYLGFFGQFHNQDPAGFPGCCNPTNVAVDDLGRIYVSEKAGPRVKVYDPDGVLLTVVAEDETFDPSSKNMDLVVAADGSILVADTARLGIVEFGQVEAAVET